MLTQLKELEEKGYVRSVAHKTLPFFVWNYTPVVQFDKLWSEHPLLRLCRGLITDINGNIVGRPYEKFFNYSEHNSMDLPLGSQNIKIENKLDGSLLIVCRFNNEVVYSTRGSFYSGQAIAGSELYKQLYSEDWIETGQTYLFEYIGPNNRIVVQYEKDDLVLHGVLDTASGLDVEVDYPFHRVPYREVTGAVFGDELYNLLVSMNIPNEEGFVIKVKRPNEPTWMCKIKFEDYCQLHKIVTGVSNKTIWEMLRDNKSFDEILEICPDEFNEWLRNTKHELEERYISVESKALDAYYDVKHLETRKDQALALKANHSEYAPIVFKMLDNSNYNVSIWNMIKPDRYVQPFTDKGEE